MFILGKGFWRSLFSQYHMHHMQDFLYATFLWLHMLVLRHWIFLLPNGFKLHVRLQVLFTDSQALGNCWSNFCKWSRLLSWESEGIIMPQCHVSPRNSRPYPGIVIISPPKTSVFDWDSGQRNPSKLPPNLIRRSRLSSRCAAGNGACIYHLVGSNSVIINNICGGWSMLKEHIKRYKLYLFFSGI